MFLWRWISDTSITFHHQVKCSGLWWRPKSVCVCVSESCGDVAEKLGVIFQIYYITHYIIFFFFCRIQLLPGKLLPVNDSSTNVGTAGVTLHNWRTSAAARLWRARSVRSGCGLWVGIDSKKSHLMEDRPDSAPPASSTVTTLFTPHKQAGRPPRFEAALCYCRKLRGSS